MSDNSSCILLLELLIQNTSDPEETREHLGIIFNHVIPPTLTYIGLNNKLNREAALKNWNRDAVDLAHSILLIMFDRKE